MGRLQNEVPSKCLMNVCKNVKKTKEKILAFYSEFYIKTPLGIKIIEGTR